MDSDTTSPAAAQPPEGRRVLAARLPTRRRAWLACTTCRSRKTRCDAAKPRCSLCVSLDVECVYKDSQQPRVDPGIRMLLERIQTLEDRLLSAPGMQAPPPQHHSHFPDVSMTGNDAGPPTNLSVPHETLSQQSHSPASGGDPTVAYSTPDHMQRSTAIAVDHDASSTAAPAPDLPYPLSHTANANHVLKWPLVQELFSAAPSFSGDYADRDLHHEATDIFFHPGNSFPGEGDPAETWRLFKDPDPLPSTSTAGIIDEYRGLVYAYFDEVNVFFPLLSRSEIIDHLDRIIDVEVNRNELQSICPPPAQYCLLLLVLCIGSFVHNRGNRIRIAKTAPPRPQDHSQADRLWSKVLLLLGHVSSTSSLEAAQCTMLTSIYLGSRGRILEAFQWSHTASTKCVALVKRQQDTYPEAFRRLFWISFIYESDFISEISIIQPSGIAHYQDLVPYPTQAAPTGQEGHHLSSILAGNIASHLESSLDANVHARRDRSEELAAFQISTNIAIRRLLNSVHSLIYDSKDHFRMKRVEYVRWLLKATGDFWSYHGTIYRNVPQFLLVSLPPWWESEHHAPDPPTSPDQSQNRDASRPEGLGNDPWNILRLQGRYYASQHIIHRPFVDYVLMNMDHIETHPDLEVILHKCALCLEGCKGFISVFNINEANSITCLFATGMATFTYLIILRLATVCHIFRDIVPDDVEHVINIGRRNMELFSGSVREFKHHLEILDRLDAACRDRMEV